MAPILAGDLHHIFPRAKSLAMFFKNNKINVNGVLAKLNGFMHRFGVHSFTYL